MQFSILLFKIYVELITLFIDIQLTDLNASVIY